MKFVKKYGMAYDICPQNFVEIRCQNEFYLVHYDNNPPQPGDGVWFVEVKAGNGEVDHYLVGVDGL